MRSPVAYFCQIRLTRGAARERDMTASTTHLATGVRAARYASAMPTKISLSVITAALALVLLSGCAPEPATSVEPSAAVSATPEPEKVENVAVGDALTPEQAKQLNGQRGTLRPYELADGTFIVIDVKQPLPESVKQEVIASIGASSNSDLGSFFRATDEQESASGKTLIVVRQVYHGTQYGGETVFGWAAASNASGFPGFDGASGEEVAAQAQAWADTTRDPAQLEVVIVPN